MPLSKHGWAVIDNDAGKVIREHAVKLCLRQWVQSMNVSEGRFRYSLVECCEKRYLAAELKGVK